ESPYFAAGEDREVKMVDIVFVTADKGLCGGFNSTTIKEVTRLMAEYKSQNVKVRLRAIGKKGISFFGFNEVELLDKVSDLSAVPDYERAAEFINKATTDFINGVTDKVVLVHNGFKNMISQELKVQDLLPIKADAIEAKESLGMMEVEPSEQEREILDQLAKKYIEFNMYYALIDSLAAEHSARMQAMDAASNNAGELVKSLTIAYNKARQEAITTELVEINTGVESMK
ncbi:MAG: ATP synthase F1 subunit gamma, partial [Wolinella sp.]